MPPLCPLCRNFESECSCTEATRLAKRWARKVLAGTWVIPGDFDEEGEYGPDVVVGPDSDELDRWYPRDVFPTYRDALDALAASPSYGGPRE